MPNIACWKVPIHKGWEALAAWPSHPRGTKNSLGNAPLRMLGRVSSFLGRVRSSSGAQSFALLFSLPLFWQLTPCLI